jgi:hypothetical protein
MPADRLIPPNKTHRFETSNAKRNSNADADADVKVDSAASAAAVSTAKALTCQKVENKTTISAF